MRPHDFLDLTTFRFPDLTGLRIGNIDASSATRLVRRGFRTPGYSMVPSDELVEALAHQPNRPVRDLL
ncbi:MAG: hypothetical protein DMG07_17295 [Acidobacteria bacterium]|nr:MAG: hypothetical protein DMG07_17295 [Acidobacteriota bacterium]